MNSSSYVPYQEERKENLLRVYLLWVAWWVEEESLGVGGERLCGFVEKMGVCSSVRAELCAMLHGLLLAKEKGFKKPRENVDSTFVVGLLQGNMSCNA